MTATRLSSREVKRAAAAALKEDIGPGDRTTRLVVPRPRPARAVIVAKQPGIIAGLPMARAVFSSYDPNVRFVALLHDGSRIKAGTVIARLSGDGRSILTAERTALNFLQHLSGVASLTRRFVERVRGLPVTILDTRKTIPGLRRLEKYAVLIGGGRNHRFGLFDGILIKDNHLALTGSLRDAIRLATLGNRRKMMVEVEANSLAQVRAAVTERVDAILLDNMTTAQLRRAVRLVSGRAFLEASGGITLDNVRAVASTGVDAISIGALTHSAPAIDLSLELAP